MSVAIGIELGDTVNNIALASGPWPGKVWKMKHFTGFKNAGKENYIGT